MDKMRALREKLNGNSLVRVAGAHDGLSAKLAEMNGFDAIWASGLGISAVHTVPDASILTMTEYLQAAVVMNDSCNIPIIADCDSGFGNIHNVARMIKKYEQNGIAGVCIEDKVFPKLNSFDNRTQELVSIEEFCSKIAIAKETQQNKDFVVIARIEALIAGFGMEEALNRGYAYVNAGADAILIHSKKTDPSEISEFCSLWSSNIPLVVVPTKYPSLTMEQMKAMGIKMSIYANQALRVSVTAINTVFKHIIENGSTLDIEAEIATVNDIFDLQKVFEMEEHEEKYSHKVPQIVT
jgi:phosphoenolpyruvate phosphomutase